MSDGIAGSPGATPPRSRSQPAAVYIALTGNPNCGKTTLFNSLTGLRAKVGNYAGVTVERKEGRLLGSPADHPVWILDLPGTYSLSPNSLDEQVSRDVLLNRLPELPPPNLIVIVVDASNLQRHLYYATQVIELGHPTLLALNMMDVAESNGHIVDAGKLAEHLGVPVLPIIASTGHGVPELRREMIDRVRSPEPLKPRLFCQLPGLFRIEAQALADLLAETFHERRLQATAEALLLLSNEKALASSTQHYPQPIQDAVAAARRRLESHGVDWRGAPIEWRYGRVAEIQAAVTTETAIQGETFSDRLDRVLTHRVWGTLIFLVVMALMFQSIFSFAGYPMHWLDSGVTWIGDLISSGMPPGDLRDLLVNGVIAGVGAVLVFLPQILMLFLFIGFLEDTGYMARAAFLMDRLMSKVGLHGRSFIPLLSSFACAIPGIMATRTIETPKDRIATILVAPLMSCSARLPVYTLLIAACIPNRRVLGILNLQGLTMLSLYLLGVVVALLMAWLFKRTILKGEPPLLILELPPYKLPLARAVIRHMWDRAQVFLRQAGTLILGINIILWFLATYPRDSAREQQFEVRKTGLRQQLESTPAAETPAALSIQAELDQLGSEQAGERLRHSFAGRLGRAIEPAIAPLGFDWKMGIGIVTSFAAREVFVSTMSTVYNLGDQGEEGSTLVQTLKEQRREDGTPVYTALTGITLLVFYVFALQCASTVAVVKRETNSWKWPVFQWLYLGALAYGLAFLTFHIGKLLGWE